MDTSTTLTSNNINKEIENNYKLALKLFINKNFIQSYKLIYQIFQNSFIEYKQGLISQNLLIKIINLYLVIIGVSLREGHLDQILSNSARNSIRSNEVHNLIGSIWSSYEIPWEIQYNLQLFYISNQDLIKDKEMYLRDINKLIFNIDSSDKYGEKLLNLIKFEIYPQFNEFEKSEQLIGSNEEELNRLNEIKQQKQTIENELKQKLIDDEKKSNELKLKKEQDARKLAHEQNLKYKSIKEITNTYNHQNSQPRRIENKEISKQNEIKSKLIYLLNISKKYLQQNTIILLVLLILIFGSSKFLKGINIKEKLIDTIKMAFKFTYI
ncbi:uncharacterized protein KGF55_000997 [Candida pseudojiufengensis]|uniref:uncharacterized protein n=1 Tax=Candida pseudojiufengensis TaxID=497109 RepID=UPI00222408FF|nr:uncharacterized protein KGF55_000997 [Candida pseudojiufengensis]KAI5965635.1 hypothetical protein KGF55_000997 [Candida pseudojiufengensis]